jgi:WD40 repeat protein
MMLAATHDGRWLASANDKLLCLWHLPTRRLQWRRDNLVTNALAMHPTSSTILCGTTKGEVLELDTSSGRTLRMVTRHADAVSCLAISSDGQRLASLGYDRRLVVTHWERAEALWTQPHYPVGAVCFSPAGDTLVSAGFLGESWALLTWDPATGEQQARLLGHEKAVLGLAFAPDNTLYSWGTDGSVRGWDLSRGVQTHSYCPESCG